LPIVQGDLMAKNQIRQMTPYEAGTGHSCLAEINDKAKDEHGVFQIKHHLTTGQWLDQTALADPRPRKQIPTTYQML